MTAAAAEVGSLHDCLDGLLDVSTRLAADFGLALEWEPLGERSVLLRARARTVIVNIDDPLENQLWSLIQVWSYLAIGPHATPAAHITRGLRIVS